MQEGTRNQRLGTKIVEHPTICCLIPTTKYPTKFFEGKQQKSTIKDGRKKNSWRNKIIPR